MCLKQVRHVVFNFFLLLRFGVAEQFVVLVENRVVRQTQRSRFLPFSRAFRIVSVGIEVDVAVHLGFSAENPLAVLICHLKHLLRVSLIILDLRVPPLQTLDPHAIRRDGVVFLSEALLSLLAT